MWGTVWPLPSSRVPAACCFCYRCRHAAMAAAPTCCAVALDKLDLLLHGDEVSSDWASGQRLLLMLSLCLCLCLRLRLRLHLCPYPDFSISSSHLSCLSWIFHLLDGSPSS